MFTQHRLIVVLKARQVGVSWLLATYALWRSLFQPGTVVMMMSQGQVEAGQLLEKTAFIYDHLPEFLRLSPGTWHQSEISFPVMDSSITALPSTQKAGRSATASLVICDEHDRHPYAEENFAAVKPTVDAGGQLISVSTINKLRSQSLFRSLYCGARDAINGFYPVFLPWHVRPGRDDAWYERVRKEAPTTATMPAELYMEQEYPASDVEALKPSRAVGAFDHVVLQQMEIDCRSPVESKSPINIYQLPVPGRRYCAGTDTAHGVGGDYAVTVVMDASTGYVVADIMSATLPPDMLALHSVELLKKYNSPIWAIEDNGWGVLALSVARDMEYRQLYCRDAEGQKPGWRTDDRSSYTVWGELIQAVEGRLITIPNREGLAQFYDVIRNPERGGRIEAQSGGHDDYPMAVGLAWQMRKYARSSSQFKPRSLRLGGQV